MKTYLFVYGGSTLLTLVITPTVIWLARRFNITDTPGPRQVHTKPTTHIGGMAIFLSTMCLAVGALFLSDVIGDAFRDILLKVIVLLSAAAFVFFVGLIDDVSGSLESAGHRASLFGRLPDEHSLIGIPKHRISSPSSTSKHTAEY